MFLLLLWQTSHAQSTCYGRHASGSIEGAVQLPFRGENFIAYSDAGITLGRTYVHSKVAEIVAAAYAETARTLPGTQFVYGETGWQSGGTFKPHRTHQNGLSVDFFVPVRDANGKSVPLPTGVTNKFGYAIDFDRNARFENLTIDFEAIGEHLYQLHSAAAKRGGPIRQVIFDLPYLPKPFATKRGAFLKANINFMKGKPWVRHDEHYHVDFDVPCKK